MAQMVPFYFVREENSGKMRQCWLSAYSPFPTMFSKRFYTRGHENPGLFGKWFNTFYLMWLTNL